MFSTFILLFFWLFYFRYDDMRMVIGLKIVDMWQWLGINVNIFIYTENVFTLHSFLFVCFDVACCHRWEAKSRLCETE